MNPTKNIPIIVIAGPTTSGKSDLAVRLALWLEKPAQKKKFGIQGAEIISADSRQVYKGLDKGSGKITKKEMLGIPHHMLDIADPRRVFSVARYQKLAKKALKEILGKNKIPIICGGTGLYIDTLIKNQSLPNVPPNNHLRKKLQTKTAQELFELLKNKDPERAKTIDSKNPVRLIRALEIIEALGKVPATQIKPLPHKVIYFCLTREAEELKKRIKKRLLQRLKSGMLEEVKQLHKNGLSYKRLEDLGLEYRYIAKFLQNKISKQEMIKVLEKEIWHYAKRQLTWFRKNKNILKITGSTKYLKKTVETNLALTKKQTNYPKG